MMNGERKWLKLPTIKGEGNRILVLTITDPIRSESNGVLDGIDPL